MRLNEKFIELYCYWQYLSWFYIPHLHPWQWTMKITSFWQKKLFQGPFFSRLNNMSSIYRHKHMVQIFRILRYNHINYHQWIWWTKQCVLACCIVE
jgi:hypothetical protein